MFVNLLNSIFDKNGFSNADAKLQYLRDLRPDARELWASYQQQDVTVDYTNFKTQEAYLLRYFPFYTLFVETELEVLSDERKLVLVCRPDVVI